MCNNAGEETREKFPGLDWLTRNAWSAFASPVRTPGRASAVGVVLAISRERTDMHCGQKTDMGGDLTSGIQCVGGQTNNEALYRIEAYLHVRGERETRE